MCWSLIPMAQRRRKQHNWNDDTSSSVPSKIQCLANGADCMSWKGQCRRQTSRPLRQRYAFFLFRALDKIDVSGDAWWRLLFFSKAWSCGIKLPFVLSQRFDGLGGRVCAESEAISCFNRKWTFHESWCNFWMNYSAHDRLWEWGDWAPCSCCLWWSSLLDSKAK